MNDTVDVTNPVEEATTGEENRFDRAFRETRRVLDECIEVLMVKERLAESTNEREQIRQDRRELSATRSRLVRRNIAFHAGTATMTPPSAELVAKIVELSKEAVALTTEKNSVSGILQLATRALNKFAEIQQIDSN